MNNMYFPNKNAFTLPEILITIGIIGVVAACVMPTLLNNIEQHVRKNSAIVFSRKFASAAEIVQATNSFGNFKSTSDFVNILEKQLQIVKRCSHSNITDCWPSDRVKLYDGSYYNIAGARNGETTFLMNYKDPSGKYADYSSNNVALVLADGTSVLLSYNTECDSDTPQISKNCIVAAFELNGKKGPNELGKDIILLNAKNFIKNASPDAKDIETTGTAGVRRR